MSIKRIACCDICNETYKEKNSGDGFPGWGQLYGINLDGIDNPYLCPYHLKKAAELLDREKEEYR